MEQVLAVLSNPSVITVVAIGLEALMRYIPTQKPLSIMHLVARSARSLADFLDKVLPQNVKE